MTHSNSWWIVTDLDGTLLDHSYSWEPARTTLRWLQEQQIPVIPCTSKTAEEVRGFRDALLLNKVKYLIELDHILKILKHRNLLVD